ncbi:MAG: hypothetical protein Q8M64_02720, partial [Methyloversatilis sp.]|nr:hypothetical protein [Methyloversatilis sp.]
MIAIDELNDFDLKSVRSTLGDLMKNSVICALHTGVAALLGAWSFAPFGLPLWVRVAVGCIALCALGWSAVVLCRRE